MKSFSGIGGVGSGANTWYGDGGWSCTLPVPKGGATSVRVKVSKHGKGSLVLEDTSVFVKLR